MNPCAKNKQRIAWMTAGVLDGTDAETLRQHVEGCAACRRYWQSMCQLSERLVNASDMPPAAPAESFHRTVVQKITAQKQRTLIFDWVTIIIRFWWERPRAALSASFVLALLTFLWIPRFRHEPHHISSGVQIAVSTETALPAAPAPTLASYRRAADISLENFDALLTQKAARTSFAVETFTVSSLLTSSLEK